MDIMRYRAKSIGMFSSSLSTNDFFGVPISASPIGMMMDVDHIMQMVLSKDGSMDKVKQYMMASGNMSSALEHGVPEKLLSTTDNPVKGVSAVKALYIANAQGIPIYAINQSNINTILPQLQIGDAVKNDILNAVNAGKVVTVSKTSAAYEGNQVVGYIIADPTTGAAAYMIGGANGADIQLAELLKRLVWGTNFFLAFTLSLYGAIIFPILLALLTTAVLACMTYAETGSTGFNEISTLSGLHFGYVMGAFLQVFANIFLSSGLLTTVSLTMPVIGVAIMLALIAVGMITLDYNFTFALEPRQLNRRRC